MLFYAHSGIRYLVLLAGVAALAYAVWGAVTKRPYDRTMKRLGSAFAGLLHLQILLGIGLLFTRPFAPYLTGHIMLMVFAAVVAQVVPSVMRRRPVEKRSYIPYAVGIVVALGLVWTGLAAIDRPLFGSAGG